MWLLYLHVLTRTLRTTWRVYVSFFSLDLYHVDRSIQELATLFPLDPAAITMAPTSSVFVDPSSLSLPSPQSDNSPTSPQPEHHDSPHPGPSTSRKRQRTELTPEERKDARAHRNRIAAQNSRDKRKAQFTLLERRVAELEAENRQLRAGMSSSDLQRADERRLEERERQRDRERENAELRERVKSLEEGWEAVKKVLSSQGLPPPAQAQTSSSSSTSPSSPRASNSPTTFPVLVPQTSMFPLTPSPSLSSSSLFEFEPETNESTRHLARVATAAVPHPAASLQRVDSPPLRLPDSSSTPSPPPTSNSTLTPSLSPLSLLLASNHNRRTCPLPTRRQFRHPSTRAPWMSGSARYLRRPPPFRRRLFLLLTTPRPPPPRPPPRR
ncbi:hypothetical protein BD410DRAFT_566404 [Rickenella mellea]|uniref:X-box-binding protein 1 n=1 Tax=Rickenella mellea TaxID=50990 RepID=A0A4Y7QEL5_9AGAM|nr:hypothetical protein BD410DRAFT_566404 [Rickenella mellea]